MNDATTTIWTWRWSWEYDGDTCPTPAPGRVYASRREALDAILDCDRLYPAMRHESPSGEPCRRKVYHVDSVSRNQ